MATLFDPLSVDANEIREADRLARRALAVWTAGCVVPFLIGLLGTGGGELALGFRLVTVIIQLFLAAAASVISIRFALRALGFHPASVLAKAMMFLSILSALAVALFAAFFLWVASLR